MITLDREKYVKNISCETHQHQRFLVLPYILSETPLAGEGRFSPPVIFQTNDRSETRKAAIESSQ